MEWLIERIEKMDDQALLDKLLNHMSFYWNNNEHELKYYIDEFIKRKHLKVPGDFFYDCIKNNNNKRLGDFIERVDKNDEIFKEECITLEIAKMGTYENILKFLEYPFANVYEERPSSDDSILSVIIENKILTAKQKRKIIQYILNKYPDMDRSCWQNEPFENACLKYMMVYDEEEKGKEYFKIIKLLLEDPRVNVTIIRKNFEGFGNGYFYLDGMEIKGSDKPYCKHAFIMSCLNYELFQLFYPRVHNPAMSNSLALRNAATINYKIVQVLLEDPRVDPTAENNEALYHYYKDYGCCESLGFLLNVKRVLLGDIRVYNKWRLERNYADNFHMFCCQYDNEYKYYHQDHPDSISRKAYIESARKILRLFILSADKTFMGFIHKELWCFKCVRDVVEELQAEKILKIQRCYRVHIKYRPLYSGYRAAEDHYNNKLIKF